LNRVQEFCEERVDVFHRRAHEPSRLGFPPLSGHLEC
jgi:hypothetical protein